MEPGMAMERISTVLNKLSQGLIEHDELHKLLKDAACSLDSTEEQYLYQVIAKLYPDIILPSPANSTPITAFGSLYQPLKGRKALADRTNKPEDPQQSQPPQQDSSASKSITPCLDSNNTASVAHPIPIISASNTDAVLNDHAGLPSALALLQQSPAAVPLAVPLLASTDQLAALVTAATTAATKAVARTILHHSRTDRSHKQGKITAADASPQQLLVSSRCQPHVSQPSGAADTSAEPTDQQQQIEEPEPKRKLLKFASVSQGPAAGARHLGHRPAPRVAPHSAAVSGTAATGTVEHDSGSGSTGPVVKYPRIWVRPDEQQQDEQLQQQQEQQQGEQLYQLGRETHTKLSGVVLSPLLDQQNHSKDAPQAQTKQLSPAADEEAETSNGPGDYQQHSLRRRRKASSGVGPGARASAAVQVGGQLDGSATADEAVQVDVGASTVAQQTLPAGGQLQQESQAVPDRQQQQRPVDYPKQQQLQITGSQQGSRSQHQQQQLREHAQRAILASESQSTQHLQQPTEVPSQQGLGLPLRATTPVVPSPVPLPPELQTAVQRTLQTFKEPLVQQQQAAGKAVWQQQQQPDEATRAVYHMLGSTFDYTAAASQLSQAAAAAQHLVAADRRYTVAGDIINMHSSKVPVGTVAMAAGQQAVSDAAAAGFASAWPGVLGDVLPPLTKFYEHEDDWQDVGRFGQAVERDITWRLAAAAAEQRRTNSHSASNRSVTFSSTPGRTSAGTPVKALAAPPPAAATATTVAAAAGQVTPRRAADCAAAGQVMADNSKSPAKRKLQLDPAAAAATAAAARPHTSTPSTAGDRAMTSVDRPKSHVVVAFGRRVDKPLPAPSLSSKHFSISPSSRVSAAVRAAQGLQPAYELPRFVDHTPAGFNHAARDRGRYRRGLDTAAGAAGQSGRTAATVTALQRLAQRRRAAAAAGGEGVSAWQEPAVVALTAADDSAADVLDVLLEALLESQQQQQQQGQHDQATQPEDIIGDLPPELTQQAADGVEEYRQQQRTFTAPYANFGQSGGRQFSAVYDLSEPYMPFLTAAGPALGSAAAAAQQVRPIDRQAVNNLQQQQQNQAMGSPQVHTDEGQRFAVTLATSAEARKSTPGAAAAGVAAGSVGSGVSCGQLPAIPDIKQEVLSVLVDEIMADLLQEQTAVAAGVTGAQALDHRLLRDLVTQELSAAMDALMAEGSTAAAAAAAAGAATAGQAVAAAADFSGVNAAGASLNLGLTKTPINSDLVSKPGVECTQHSATAVDDNAQLDDHLDTALLHALTDALLSTGLVAPAPPAANKAVAAAAAEVSPKRSNAEIRASIAKLRVKTGRHKQRRPVFGNLPGLHRTTALAGTKQVDAEAGTGVGGGASEDLAAAGAAVGVGSSLAPGSTEQLGGTALAAGDGAGGGGGGGGGGGNAREAVPRDHPGSGIHEPQQQQLDVATGQHVSTTQSIAGGANDTSSAPAMYAVDIPGQRQPKYVLVPVSALTSLQQTETDHHHHQQQQQQQTAAAMLQPNDQIDASGTGQSPPTHLPAYGVDGIRSFSSAGATGAQSRPRSPLQHQQQQQQQWQADQGLDQESSGWVTPAFDITGNWHHDRLSLPGSDCLRDSSDTFTSSIASSRVQGQRPRSHAQPIPPLAASAGLSRREPVTVTHVSSRQTAVAPWQVGYTAAAGGGVGHAVQLPVPTAAAAAEREESFPATGGVASRQAVQQAVCDTTSAADPQGAAAAPAAPVATAAGGAAAVAPSVAVATAAPDTALNMESGEQQHSKDFERNHEQQLQQQQQLQGQSDMVGGASSESKGSSSSSGGGGVGEREASAMRSVSSSSCSAVPDGLAGDLGLYSQASDLKTAAAAAAAAAYQDSLAEKLSQTPAGTSQDIRVEGLSGKNDTSVVAVQPAAVLGASSSTSSSSRTGGGSSGSTASQPTAAVVGGKARAATVGEHAAGHDDRFSASGEQQQQQQQAAVADLHLPELLVLSSSSGSSGGSMRCQVSQSAAAAAAQRDMPAASVRLWRPPKEAVAAAAAAAAEQAAAALAAATAAAAAAAGNSRTVENLQHHLIRFPLPLYAGATLAGATTTVTAAGGAGSSSKADQAMSRSGVTLPSPEMSSVVELESSTTTLTTITTDSSSGSSSSGTTGSNSLDWSMLRALGIGVPSSGLDIISSSAAAAAAGGGIVGRGSSMQHGSADHVQAVLSGNGSQSNVQHPGTTHNPAYHTGHHTVTVAAALGAAAMASGSSSYGQSGHSASVSPSPELLRRQKLRHLAQRRQQVPLSSNAVGINRGRAVIPEWAQGQSADVSFGLTDDVVSSVTGGDSGVHDSLTSSGSSSSSSGTSSSGDSGASDDHPVGVAGMRDNSSANTPQQQQQPTLSTQTAMPLDTVGDNHGDHGSVGRSLSVGDSSLDRIHSVASSMASN